MSLIDDLFEQEMQAAQMGVQPEALRTQPVDVMDRYTFQAAPGVLNEAVQVEDPLIRAEQIEKASQAFTNESRNIGRQYSISARADVLGDPVIQRKVQKAFDKTKKPEKSAIETVMDVVDAPHALVREQTTGIKDYNKYMDHLRKEYPDAMKVAGIIGAPLGMILSGIGGVAAAGRVGVHGAKSFFADSPEEEKEELNKMYAAASSMPDTLTGLVKDAHKVGQEGLVSMLGDPLTYATYGAGGVTKLAAKQVVRSALRSGMKKSARKALEKQVVKAVEGGALNKSGVAQTMAKLAVQHGADEKKFVDHLMKSTSKLENLGRGGFGIGLPLSSKGVALPGGELPGRAFAPMKRGFRKATEGITGIPSDLTGFQRDTFKQGMRQLRSMPNLNVEKELAILNRKIRGANISDERLKELMERYRDPDFTPLKGVDDEFTGGRSTGNQLFREDLAENELVVMDAMDEFFTRQHKRMKDIGIEVGDAYNPVSGKYTPRILKDESAKLAKGGNVRGGYNPAKPRGEMGGTPMGRKPGMFEEDLDRMMRGYSTKVERQIAEKHLDRWIADHFHDPGMDLAQGKVITGLSGEQRKVPQPILDAFESLKTQEFERYKKGFFGTLTDLFKETVLLGRPAYAFVNIFGDGVMMYANGFDNPKWFKQASKVWDAKIADDAVLAKSASGKQWTKGEIRKYLEDSGVGQQLGHFDLDPATAGRNTLKASMMGGGKMAQIRADKKGFAKEAAKEVASGLPGGRQLIKRGTRWWDKTGKTAFFMDRLAKGDDMQSALARTFDVMYDYGSQDKLLRQLRKVAPFASWQYKSLAAVPRTVLRNPGRAALPFKLQQAADDPSQGDVHLPGYLTERGGAFRLGGETGQQIRKFVEAWSGHSTGGLDTVSRVRDPISEAVIPIFEMAFRGNLDPLAQQLSPFIRIAAEAAMEKDAFSKRRLTRPELTSLFQLNDPIAIEIEKRMGLEPGALQADEGQMAWGTKLIPQFGIGPVAQFIVNAATRQAGARGPSLGSHYDYSSSQELREPLSLFNMMMGMPTSLVSPTDEIRELQYKESRELENLESALKAEEQRRLYRR